MAIGLPVRVTINALGVDQNVVYVGLTNSLAMDVPTLAKDIGWYMKGAKPGQRGNAVIAAIWTATTGRRASFEN
jgi:sortase A